MADVLERLNAALSDRYRIEGELGQGGMATVYLAQDLKHDRKVALKVLKPELTAVLGGDRFIREIKTTASLQHPHILPLFDSGSADGFLFYVMPYIEGETLRDKLGRETQLAVDEAVRITHEVADAIDHAHRHGIIHRDIKPENILLSDGHALVSDFGIARAATLAEAGRRTATGIAVGTPAYMSPEQAAGDPAVDARSDLYSLACVTWEMLAGRPPFRGTPQAVTARRLIETVPRVRTVRPAVPASLDAALARALSRAPADRQDSVREFVREVGDIGQPATVVGWRAIAGAALVLVLAVVVALVIAKAGSGPARIEAPRLAVLPLDNLGDEADAPFAAGIAEEIMSRLSGIGGLQVVSRTSASRFRDSRLGMRELGVQLHADYILEGSVRTDRGASGSGSARVTARLVRTADDVRVWEHPFDVALVPGDIFRVQSEIATRVAAALNLTLGNAEQRRVARVTTTDSAAYRFYQLGRYQWAKRDAESLIQAQASFRAAVARDSTFAEAWAGLSDALGASVLLYPDDSAPLRRQEALHAAQRAVAFDSSLAAAHAALGFDRFFFEWDWSGAESAFQHAIALDPGYGPARYWYTQLLWMMERPADALSQAEEAVAIDPMSAVAYLARARSYRLLGRPELWFADLQRANQLQELAPTWSDLAEHYGARGVIDSARLAMSRFMEIRFGIDRPGSELLESAVRPRSGTADIVRGLQLLEQAGVPGLQTDALAANWFAQAGLNDSAFSRLRRMEAQRSPELVTAFPFLKPLLDRDPVWTQLRHRLDDRQAGVDGHR